MSAGRAVAAWQALQRSARRLKGEVMTMWFALRHPGAPWGARVLGAVVVAYALSPINLIPDFIPVLGLLDDLLILPALVWLVVRMLPPDVLRDARAQAEAAQGAAKPRSLGGLCLVLGLWLAMGAALAAWWWA